MDSASKHATSDDQNLVKLNQQSPVGDSDGTSSLDPKNFADKPSGPAPAPSTPPVPLPAPPVQPPPPATDAPPVISPPAPPTPATPEENVGVGKPNIGVEDDKSASAEPPAPTPSPNKPAEAVPPPPVVAPPNDSATIETQTEIPIKTYDKNRIEEKPSPDATPAASPPVVGPSQNQTPPAGNTPPVKANSGSPAAAITMFALLALVIGASGGFLGFRYFDKLKTSASESKTEATATPSSQTSPSLDVNLWQTFASTAYNFTLKYPNGWFASTTEPTAEDIIFASNKESLTGDPTGQKIEINFQGTNGKTLKSWVEANSTAANEKNPPKEITVDGQTAYQQTLANPKPAIATYIARQEKVMIVTLTAPSNLMADGGNWYNTLINSFKLK